MNRVSSARHQHACVMPVCAASSKVLPTRLALWTQAAPCLNRVLMVKHLLEDSAMVTENLDMCQNGELQFNRSLLQRPGS
ncbi:hypothetical protein L484_005876 [Morus notabilis]|uniref:Uncharacterized protein n=1 Tax=Morus notabilis TaxID=981085 RepID=W9QZ16_9ROSA|nr:hypothetical protein L484_005876 [Morus notabilis]